MRALITGGSGFVGRALTAHLEAEGDEIVFVDRAKGGVDITDRASIGNAVQEADAEVVYHLAAQAHVPTAWKEPVATMRCNVEGTINVLDAAYEAGVKRVIFASSAEVYGSVTAADLPVTEAALPQPNNPYAASKLAAEAYVGQSFYSRDQEVIILRSFNQFGPGQATGFVSSSFANQIARAELGGPSDIKVGRLDTRRDFIDVRDVARAFRLAATSGRAGAIYNVCSEVDRAVSEIANGLAEKATIDVRFVRRTDLLRTVDTPVVRGDASALNADTGWTPEINFETTLHDVLVDARARVANGED